MFRRERTGTESRKKGDNVGNEKENWQVEKREENCERIEIRADGRVESSVFLEEHGHETKGSGWLMHFSMYLRHGIPRTPSLLGKQLHGCAQFTREMPLYFHVFLHSTFNIFTS